MRGFRRAGYRSVPFASFGNWFEPLRGRRWDAYLADRPGALRETIRRRMRRAERDGGLAFGVAGPGETAAYLAEYQQVYAQSWKQAEPFPAFAAAFVAEAARAGVLRIAVLRRDGRAVAAQYWTVEHGIATVLKLAHVETARNDSPGTVLTAWMIRRLVDVRSACTASGLRPRRRLRTSGTGPATRRQRAGLVVADPRRPRGAAALLRQVGSRLAGRLRG